MKQSSLLCIFAALYLCVFASLATAEELPRRAWIGIGFQPLDDSTRTLIADSGGVRIAQFMEYSPAPAAGLLIGDVLLKLNGKTITGGQQLALQLKDHRVGESVMAELWRDGEYISKDILLAEAPREKPPDFDVLYESFEMDGALRRTIITKPRREGTFPTVVMLGGLGCYSLDNTTGLLNAYNEVLYALTRAGFSTVRIEKTGMGDSQGKPCAESDFDYEVQGLVAGLKSLENYSYVDRDNIILFGHSMGGFTGPCVANEFPVKGIVAMATSAIGWFEYMMTNTRRQLALEGVPYDSIEIKLAQAERAMYLHYVEKQMPDDIFKDHPEYGEYLQSPMHHTFLQDVADLNIAEKWKNVDARVLFLYGSSDFITAREEHLYGVNVVNSFHPGQAEYIEIDDLDHYFLRVPGQQASFDNLIAGMPLKTMNRDCIPVITDWCKDVVNMDARRAVER